MAQLKGTEIEGNLVVSGRAMLSSTASTMPTNNRDFVCLKYIDDYVSPQLFFDEYSATYTIEAGTTHLDDLDQKWKILPKNFCIAVFNVGINFRDTTNQQCIIGWSEPDNAMIENTRVRLYLKDGDTANVQSVYIGDRGGAPDPLHPMIFCSGQFTATCTMRYMYLWKNFQFNKP